MLEKIKNLNSVEIVLNDGVDEASAVTNVPLNKLIQMHNWRLSDIGDRIEKRDGLGMAIVSDSTLGDKDIFGYHTYYDGSSNFCQLVITEDKIWRKVGAAAWASIHTWASTLAHPVKVLEIQGKQIIVTEIENKMILSDGTLVQFGISAPATIPTLTDAYNATLLDEDMAAIADWTDDDQGAATSTQTTFDSKSCMRLLNTATSGDIARRYRTVADVGDEITIEFSIYFDTFGVYQDNDYFLFEINNGKFKTKVRIDQNDLAVYEGDYWVNGYLPIKIDTWLEFKIYINTADPDDPYCEIYMDGKAYGSFRIGPSDSSSSGKTQVSLYGDATATDAYIDYMKIGDATGGELNGLYRYAVTYRRNSGNYPGESNPIKSLVGTAIITGAGLDDLTAGGTYTGEENIDVRVEIDGTGTPDTVKISYDGGTTWHTQTMNITSTMYLNYGIELTWGATTGHTSGDYWDLTCSALTADPCHQKVTLSAIPTSSDSQVDQRRIYRTQPGGTAYYLVATINDNTTTSFVDNVPDGLLGIDMSEANDIAPLGKFVEWFDDRLWIGDADENIVYYSKTNIPDAFDTDNKYVSVRRGESDDTLTGLIDYKSYLYAFKRKSIYMIRKKTSAYYGRYEVCDDFGCIAPWSLLSVFGLLTFVSDRGWEIFNGCQAYTILWSLPLKKTLATIDKSGSKLDLIIASPNRAKNEIWLSIPDRTGGESAITCVVNYFKNAFYTFSFNKTPSCFMEARDSNKELKTYVGSRDASLYEAESGTRDGLGPIDSYVRLSWLTFPIYSQVRFVEYEYECPTDKTLTVDYYINFDKDSFATKTLTGATPTATDQSIRLPIKSYSELFLRGKYISIKFSNDEYVGSDIKLNWFKLFYAPFERKGEIKGD